MTYVKVNNTLYEATIDGNMADIFWDGRESKTITLEGDFPTVNALFSDGVEWSIVYEESIPSVDTEGNPVLNDVGEQIYQTTAQEYDNSEYNMRGDITVHSNGTCSVKMGKKTELEIINESYAILMGDME